MNVHRLRLNRMFTSCLANEHTKRHKHYTCAISYLQGDTIARAVGVLCYLETSWTVECELNDSDCRVLN